jgi:hypothetical protein
MGWITIKTGMASLEKTSRPATKVSAPASLLAREYVSYLTLDRSRLISIFFL